MFALDWWVWVWLGTGAQPGAGAGLQEELQEWRSVPQEKERVKCGFCEQREGGQGRVNRHQKEAELQKWKATTGR